MRKALCILLTIYLMISLACPAFAKSDAEPQFGTIPVEYTDAPGKLENLEVMASNNHVYVDARVISERLGYRFEQTGNVVTIYAPTSLFAHSAPLLAVHFRLDDTSVSYNPLFGMEHRYTTPCPAIQNDRGVWVPLRYTLDLLGGGSNVLGDVLRIQTPCENVLSIAALIANYSDDLAFDWTKDFGYSESSIITANSAARIVNLFNGLLKFDYSSWCLFAHWTAFDVKFGRVLTTMLCTKSNDEFEEEVKYAKQSLDILSPESTLGNLLKQRQVSLDTDVGEWKIACDEYLKMVKNGAGSTAEYNRLYNQLEMAMDRQDLFSSLGGDALVHVQGELSFASNVLDITTKIGEVVTYYREFQHADSFTTSALWDYLYNHTKTDEISYAMEAGMLGYVAGLKSDATLHSATRFIEENLMEILMEDAGLDTMLGLPANIALLAWDIMSDRLPFYEGGLKAVEAREISNYAQKLQNDAQKNIEYKLSGLKTDTIPLTPQACMELAEYCYVFLKACYVARDSALCSLDLEHKDEDFLKKAKGMLDEANNTNDIIAYYLSILSQANEKNECMILGFLPENNAEYLDNDSDETLLAIVDYEILTDTSADTSIDHDKLANAAVACYIPVIEKAIAGTAYDTSTGSGILYDMDGDGIEELVILNVYAEVGESIFPGHAYSVYDIENGEVIIKRDKELLFYDAGGPAGYVGIVNYIGNPALVVYIENGETGSNAHRESLHTLYSPDNLQVIVSAGLDYVSGVNYKTNSCTVNGENCRFEEYLQVVDAIDSVMIAEIYSNDGSDGSMGLYELLHFIQQSAGIVPEQSPQISRTYARQIADSVWSEYLSRTQGHDWKVFEEGSIVKDGIEYYCYTLQTNSRYGADDWSIFYYLFVNSVTGEYCHSLYDGSDLIDNDDFTQVNQPEAQLDPKPSEITEELIGEWIIDAEYTVAFNGMSMWDFYGSSYSDSDNKMVFNSNGSFNYYVAWCYGNGTYELQNSEIILDLTSGDPIEGAMTLGVMTDGITRIALDQYGTGDLVFWRKS